MYAEKAKGRRTLEAEILIDRITLGVNTGTLITYDRDALRRWQSTHRKPQSSSGFSSTVNRLAQMFPEKVKTH